MPFIRYTRDKRGYEHTFVMHAYRASKGSQHGRVLYMFRSPSSVKIGRGALDSEAKEALEHTHPDLVFDWAALLREPGVFRAEPRERPRKRARGRSATTRSAAAAPPAADQESSEAVIDDESVLGRTLGAREAARLRARYADLVQRIARRARTADERDRLAERAARLNPDDWADEAAVRAAAGTIEGEWNDVAAELPQRRRGRRGWRNRPRARAGEGGRRAGQAEPDVPGAEATGSEPDQAQVPSVIMGGGEGGDGPSERGGTGRENPGADGGGDRDRVGSDAPAADDTVPAGPAGDGLPGDG